MNPYPALWQALDENRLSEFSQILRSALPTADYYDQEGNNILHRAVDNSNLPAVELLLELSPQYLLEEFDELDQTPLMAAVEMDSLPLVKCLVEAGAKVNAQYLESESSTGDTALILAIQSEQADVLQFLLASGANPVQKDLLEDTPLHHVVAVNHLELLEILLRYLSKEQLNLFGDFDETALTHAARDGKLAIAKRLLEAGANPNAQDETVIGSTALNEAVKAAQLEMVQLLLEYGADPKLSGWMGLNAFDRAADLNTGNHQTNEQIRQILAPYRS